MPKNGNRKHKHSFKEISRTEYAKQLACSCGTTQTRILSPKKKPSPLQLQPA